MADYDKIQLGDVVVPKPGKLISSSVLHQWGSGMIVKITPPMHPHIDNASSVEIISSGVNGKEIKFTEFSDNLKLKR